MVSESYRTEFPVCPCGRPTSVLEFSHSLAYGVEWTIRHIEPNQVVSHTGVTTAGGHEIVKHENVVLTVMHPSPLAA